MSLALLLAATVTLVACGSDNKGQSTSSEPKVKTAPADEATVRTVKVPGFGTVLATGPEKTLYVDTADPAGGSSCSGKCIKEFKPLKPEGELTAGPGTDPALLSSFTRDDGSEQVLYDDKALYTHTGPGAISGAGVESDRGIWLLIEPSGQPIAETDAGGY